MMMAVYMVGYTNIITDGERLWSGYYIVDMYTSEEINFKYSAFKVFSLNNELAFNDVTAEISVFVDVGTGTGFAPRNERDTAVVVVVGAIAGFSEVGLTLENKLDTPVLVEVAGVVAKNEVGAAIVFKEEKFEDIGAILLIGRDIPAFVEVGVAAVLPKIGINELGVVEIGTADVEVGSFKLGKGVSPKIGIDKLGVAEIGTADVEVGSFKLGKGNDDQLAVVVVGFSGNKSGGPVADDDKEESAG